MHDMILTNNKETNLKKILSSFSDKADKIKVATAFFSDTEFIKDWLDKSKKNRPFSFIKTSDKLLLLENLFNQNLVLTFNSWETISIQNFSYSMIKKSHLHVLLVLQILLRGDFIKTLKQMPY